MRLAKEGETRGAGKIERPCYFYPKKRPQKIVGTSWGHFLRKMRAKNHK
jgi:hypothetical protein